jgi:catechol 2,3-dioxygenase-like lactoylglutathione lyase family enzyme
MQPRGILETVLYVDDLITAEKFYEDVLGLKPFVQEPGRHLFYRCGGQVFLIFNPQATRDVSKAGIPVPTHGADGPGHLCFRASADEIDNWRDQLKAHQVEIEMDFEWPQGGRSLYFRDPAGNSLEFAEPRIWGLDL